MTEVPITAGFPDWCEKPPLFYDEGARTEARSAALPGRASLTESPRDYGSVSATREPG